MEGTLIEFEKDTQLEGTSGAKAAIQRDQDRLEGWVQEGPHESQQWQTWSAVPWKEEPLAEPHVLVAVRDRNAPGPMGSGMARKLRGGINLLYSALIKPHLDTDWLHVGSAGIPE